MLLALYGLIRIFTKFRQVAYLGQLWLHVIHSSLRHLLSLYNISTRNNCWWSAIPEVHHTPITVVELIWIFLRVILFADLIRKTFLLHYEVLLLVHCSKVDCFPPHILKMLVDVLVDILKLVAENDRLSLHVTHILCVIIGLLSHRTDDLFHYNSLQTTKHHGRTTIENALFMV